FDQPIAGHQLGEFDSPSDVALAKDGSVLIADTGNHRVQKRCAGTGRFAGFDGTQLAASVFLVLYGSQAQDRFVYIPFFQRLEIWPAALGRDPGSPSETVVAARGITSLAVAKAEVLRRIAATGSTDILKELEMVYPSALGLGVPFSRPRRLAVDQQGRIYVVDDDRDSVAVLDPAGRLLADLTYADQASGRFRPAAVSVDGSGNLIVAAGLALHRFRLDDDRCSYQGCCARLIDPCVALDCTQQSAVLCSARASCPVSTVPAPTAFTSKGQCIVAGLDSRIDRCKWDKIR